MRYSEGRAVTIMSTSAVQRELDPNDVFGPYALVSGRNPRPVLVNKVSRTRAVLVGQSPRARQVVKMIEKLGRCRWPALLLGETGTGKEVVSRLIHSISPAGPLVS